MDILFDILFSFSAISFGVMVIINPKFYSPIYGITFDFTSYKIPLGVISIFTGLGYFWATIKKKRGKKP